MSEIINDTAPEVQESAPETETPETEPAAEKTVEEYQAELEKALKAQKLAETALTHNKSEMAKLKAEKRQQLTVEEQLAEKQKDIAEKEAELNMRLNVATAKNVLSDLALTDVEIGEDEIKLLVRPDEAETTALCQWVTSLVKGREARAAKAEREKVMKEMPKPPTGDKPESEDLFLQGFNQGYRPSVKTKK